MKFKKFEQQKGLPVFIDPMSRRMFLRTLAGFVSIPFLPSLVSSKAFAQSNGIPTRAVFSGFRWGVHWYDWWPQGVNMQTVMNNVRAGQLNPGNLGPYFKNDLNGLESKLTFIRGLDMVGTAGHSNAAALTCSARGLRSDGTESDGRSVFPDSIDEVLGNSNIIYPSGSNMRVFRLQANGSGNNSFCFSGGVTQRTITDSAVAFQRLSSALPSMPPGGGGTGGGGTGGGGTGGGGTGGGGTGGGGTGGGGTGGGLTDQQKADMRRKLVVDEALTSLNQVTNSRKIATSDRTVISNFMDYLRDIQTNINAQNQSAVTTSAASTQYCSNVSQQSDTAAGGRGRNMADIMVAALACGATRIGYLGLGGPSHALAHAVNNPNERLQYVDNLHTILQPVMYMMQQMDQITEANGATLLDNSLVMTTSDMGSSKFLNHCGMSAPVMLGGGLGGRFKTGEYIDYWDNNVTLFPQRVGLTADMKGGVPYAQLHVSILQAMGLAPSDYQRGGQQGFGNPDICHHNQCSQNDVTTAHVQNWYRSNSRNSTLRYLVG